MRALAASILLIGLLASPAAAARPLLLSGLTGPECVRGVSLRGGSAGYGNLSFFYSLNRRATVTLTLERRVGSPQRRSCPTRRGHSLATYSPVATLTGPGDPGGNQIIVGSAAAARRRVSISARTLTPGTYVLFLSAIDANGQRSSTLKLKFWILQD